MNDKSLDSVAFKGTRQGIIVSIREDFDFSGCIENLEVKIKESRAFFSGAAVSIDLGWRELNIEELESLLDVIYRNKLKLLGIVSTSLATRNLAERHNIKVIIGRLGLAGHAGRKKNSVQGAAAVPQPRVLPSDMAFIHRKIVRSGTSLHFDGSVIIMGDINSGGEVMARGDIYVMGAVRGVVHAGCEGNEKSCIFALDQQFTRLQIAQHAASEKDKKKIKKGVPHLSIVEEGKIISLPYNKRQ
ncbi:MAG: hypothetical protein M1269_05540 [Chloroflexi bacterium]|nr:hypothetical protein [Chloroflexota bacterium]